jgi:hypothetical protein
MSMRVLGAAAALTIAAAATAYATPFEGTYSAGVAGANPNYVPTINDDGGSFLPSPFSGSLTVGTPTAPTTFLQVAPVNAGASAGTQLGTIVVGMTITDPSGAGITGVTTSAGGNGATLNSGTMYFTANYAFYYGNQTDCLTWNSTTCFPSNNTSTVGETLAATFADGSVLDISLYNWSDWDMAPSISFELVSGPTLVTVPEPASLAVFGAALLGLCMVRRVRTSAG